MINVEIDLVCDLRSFSGGSLAHEQESSGQNDHKRDQDLL